MAKRDPSAGSVTELGGEGVWMIGDVRERDKRSVEEMLPVSTNKPYTKKLLLKRNN